MKRIFTISIMGLVTLGAFNVNSQSAQTTVLQGENRAQAIKTANAAINAMDNIEGKFVQYNSNNSTNAGKFWLDRPGKMRFEYDAPSQLLLVADGSSIAINDKKLNTVERYPLRANPLYFVLKQNLNLASELNVTQVLRNGGKYQISLRDKKNEAQGELTLYFTANNQLEQWSVVDNRKRVTTVKLYDIKTSGSKPASFFYIKDPKRPVMMGKGGK